MCIIITITKEISRQFAPKLMRPSRGSSAPIDPLFFFNFKYYSIPLCLGQREKRARYSQY
nr:MAG TPA: hypothetical protein [Caudoviricetes sp.]